MRMMPSEVVTAQALLVLVVSRVRLSKTWPPSAYQVSRAGVAGGPPLPLAAPFAAPAPPGGVAVETAPMVSGRARAAAPQLFEFSSAVAAALCALPVSAVCAKRVAEREMWRRMEGRLANLVYRRSAAITCGVLGQPNLARMYGIPGNPGAM